MKNKLVLRTCNANGTSSNSFQWNLEIGGITTDSDWKPISKCGNGFSFLDADEWRKGQVRG